MLPFVRDTCWTISWCVCLCLASPGAFAQTPGDDTRHPSPDPTDDDQNPSLDEQLETLEREVDARTDDNPETSDASETPSDRVDELEEVVDTESDGSRDDNPRALNPELSVILNAGAAWQANDPVLVGGPDPRGFGPFLQSVELAVRADVDPFFTFDSHLVAGPAGLKVGEAYGTTLALPADLQVRFGKFKARFGRVNPLHLHAWHFTALPLVNGKFFGPAGLNGLGAEIGQLLPVPWYAEWILGVQDLSGEATGRPFLREPASVEGPLDLVATARLEQFFELSADVDLLWGLGTALGRNDSGGAELRDELGTAVYGTDLFVKYNPARTGGRSEVGWQTEAMLRQRQTPGRTLTDAGGYSYLYWRPNRRWEVGGRYEYVTGPFAAERDYLHPDWLDVRQRAGLGVSLFPSEFSRLRLEYMADGFDRGVDDLGHTVILQTQLVTGAHGAHKY